MKYDVGYFFTFNYRVVTSNVVFLTCHHGHTLAIDYWIDCTRCGDLFFDLLIGCDYLVHNTMLI